MNTLELASHGPVIPVIVIHDLADAVPLARALVEGGVKVLEVTLRTPVALRCMEAIAAAVPGAIVGAGTIRSVADARDAKNAGCTFGVSPGYTSEVGRACRDIGLPLLDADDASLDAEELADKYAGEDGSWGEHPIFRRQEWREEVANDDTLQGYWAWVVSKLNED